MVSITMSQIGGLKDTPYVADAVTADRLWYGLLVSVPKIKELILWLARNALERRAKM